MWKCIICEKENLESVHVCPCGFERIRNVIGKRTVAPVSARDVQDILYYKKKNILDKMIWSFEQIVTNSEEPQLPDEAVQRVDMKDGIWNYEIDERVKKKFWDDTQAYNNRIQEGLHLFAEYFRDLWW